MDTTSTTSTPHTLFFTDALHPYKCWLWLTLCFSCADAHVTSCRSSNIWGESESTKRWLPEVSKVIPWTASPRRQVALTELVIVQSKHFYWRMQTCLHRLLMERQLHYKQEYSQGHTHTHLHAHNLRSLAAPLVSFTHTLKAQAPSRTQTWQRVYPISSNNINPGDVTVPGTGAWNSF